MKFRFTSLLLLFIAGACFAQEGRVEVIQDSSVQNVISLYQTFAKEKRQENGYRIQLASNNSRQDLLTMKAKFIQQFPDQSAYVEYAAPQFKLRVGDFRNRSDADSFLIELRKIFSSGFIVPDKIVIEGVEW